MSNITDEIDVFLGCKAVMEMPAVTALLQAAKNEIVSLRTERDVFKRAIEKRAGL